MDDSYPLALYLVDDYSRFVCVKMGHNLIVSAWKEKVMLRT